MQSAYSYETPTNWDKMAAYVRGNYTVLREWPNGGFIIEFDGAVQKHQLFVARNNPGWQGVEHLTIEAGLGPAGQVDVLLAAKCASKMLGGVVCADEFVSIRDSRCLSTLTTDHLNMTIGYMGGALDGYLLALRK